MVEHQIDRAIRSKLGCIYCNGTVERTEDIHSFLYYVKCSSCGKKQCIYKEDIHQLVLMDLIHWI